MLGYFPTPYPDELLYSIVARYHIRSGNKSFLQTHQELFETTELQPDKIILPNNLNFLVSQLPQGSLLTVESLIKRNTLYPFFRTFLTPVEIYSFKNLLVSKLSTSISQAAKVFDRERNSVIKFCSKCQQDDKQKYGEAYWHRNHQVPSILVCLKHHTPLSDSRVFLNSNKIHYYAASQENFDKLEVENVYPEALIQKSLWLGEEICWLTNNYIEFKGMTWLRNQYKLLLIEKQFITKYSNTRFKYHGQQTVNAFLEFYGREFLQIIQPQLLEKLEKYLEYYLLSCDITQKIDRITHILIIKFLCGSIRNIFC